MIAEIQKPSIDFALGIITMLLAVFLGFQAAQMTLTLFNKLPTHAGATVSRQSMQTSHSPAAYEIDRLLSWHLFGKIDKQRPVELPKENIEAPETKLSLVLEGVSVSEDPSKSSAIVAESRSGSAELYWIGDSIAGKAILNAVYDDRIILKQNERLETLWFSEEAKTGGGLSPVSSLDSVTTSRNEITNPSDMLRSYRSRRDQQNEMVNEIGSALNEVNQGNFQTLDNLLDQYGSEMEGNIERAARSVGLEEVSGGVKVGQSAQDNWTAQVGLRPGDVIQSVNSFPVLALKSDRAAIDSVIKSCVARIEVQRGERTFILTYPFCR